MSYEFPNFHNTEIRQTFDDPNELRRADGRGVTYAAPSQQAQSNTVPDRYTPQGTQPVYGTQVFNSGRGWFEMPQNEDINHREIHLKINEGLYYRGNLGTPRRETPASRVFAPSVTRPTNDAARFINGKMGDVYGG